MGNIWKIAAATVGVLAVAELGASAYMYRRTMTRTKQDMERTMKMAGTDWSQYMPLMEVRKQYMLSQPHEDVYIQSDDNLRLHATYFPQKDEKKVVICFHGYTSQGMSDYIGLSDYYLKRGYSMLLVDERAHGQSEGKFIGFGNLDRHDAVLWMKWIIKKCGSDVNILLHGTSMGAATVLMASGLTLPRQVKGIVSDCAFTSPKHVFTHVLKSMYHLPAFPMIQISDLMNRFFAGYGLDDCNAAREVRKATVPILLIHGSGDTFVPCRMCDEIERNCRSKVTKLIIPGAAHAESYYKDMQAYENALNTFTESIFADSIYSE